MLFDSHAHLNDKQFSKDRKQVIQRAREEYDVTGIVNIGYNQESIRTSLALAEEVNFIYTAIGWHPHDAASFTEKELKWLKDLCSHPKVVALGEMGLDYYRNRAPREIQAKAFRKQIRLAREMRLPVVIHCREAYQDTLRILKEEKAEEVGGVMHCFGGDLEIAAQCLEMGFMIGLGGPVTFKNGHLAQEVATKVPLDRLLIETDAPYLAPHPHRGKRNESGYVRLVAEKIAQLRGIPFEELAQQTTANACRLFGLAK